MNFNGVVVLGNHISSYSVEEKDGLKFTNLNRTISDAFANEERLDMQGITEAINYYYFSNGESFNGLSVAPEYQERFEYILVDEYQDTNFAQHLIITQLARKHNHMCVVGDDAQSIYSFRGANISNILDLKKSFPALQTFKLERNYRSTKNIIGAANSLIDKNKRQIKKNIYSENPVGSKVNVVECYNDYEEAYVVASTITSLKAREGCSYDDFAVLYRTNAQSRVLEDALGSGGLKNKHGDKRRPIPYRIYGGLSFYQRKCPLLLSPNHQPQ